MKILIVGLGSMGKRRARLLRGLDPQAELWGVDMAQERREQAEDLGIKTFASLDKAFAAMDAGLGFGAALVCTAPLTHAVIIRQLLARRLPTFTELNLVADGYEENMALARELGVPLFLSSTMLYRLETQFIKGEAQSYMDAMGRPVNYVYHVGQYLPDWHPWENYQRFFVGAARTGGVRELLAVELPWLVDAFGPVTGHFALGDKISDLAVDYADSVFVTLQHESGVTGQLICDVVSPKAVRNLEVYGEGLHLFWEGAPDSLARYSAKEKRKEKVELYEKAVQDPRYSDNIVENAYVDELENFFAVVRGEAEPRWSFAKDAAVLRLMDTIAAATDPRKGA